MLHDSFSSIPTQNKQTHLWRFQSGLQMKRRKVITAKLSIRVLIYNILIIVYWYQEIKVASSSQLSYSLSFIKSITLLNLELPCLNWGAVIYLSSVRDHKEKFAYRDFWRRGVRLATSWQTYRWTLLLNGLQYKVLSIWIRYGSTWTLL